jgi:hypothetical protein
VRPMRSLAAKDYKISDRLIDRLIATPEEE